MTAEEVVWSVAGVDEVGEVPPPPVPPGLRRLGEWPIWKAKRSQRERKLEKEMQWNMLGKECRHLVAAVELVEPRAVLQRSPPLHAPLPFLQKHPPSSVWTRHIPSNRRRRPNESCERLAANDSVFE